MPCSAVVYQSTVGQTTINNTPLQVNFDTPFVDTTSPSTVTRGSGWVFTAPVDGMYLVYTQVTFDMDTAGSRQVFISHSGSSNGTPYIGNQVATNQPVSVTATGAVQCTKGDTIFVQANQSSGNNVQIMSSAGAGAYTYIVIVKIA